MFSFKIYTLSEPNDKDNIRYVGITTKSLKERLRHHISETKKYVRDKKHKSHKINWINNILSENNKPFINLIYEDVLTIHEISKKEQYYIKIFKILGYNLVNSTNGGKINLKMSDDVKEKISKSKKGIKKGRMCDEQKIKISKSRIESLKCDILRDSYREKALIYEKSKTEIDRLNDIMIQKNRKDVYQYDLKGNLLQLYPSIRNAAKINSLDKSNIIKSCNNIHKTCGGFIWRFK